jgi:hypothetical protein
MTKTKRSRRSTGSDLIVGSEDWFAFWMYHPWQKAKRSGVRHQRINGHEVAINEDMYESGKWQYGIQFNPGTDIKWPERRFSSEQEAKRAALEHLATILSDSPAVATGAPSAHGATAGDTPVTGIAPVPVEITDIEVSDRVLNHQQLSQSGDSNMQATIERLKREQQEDYEAGEKAGLDDGASWAKDTASLADIKRICRDGVDVDELPDLLEVWSDASYLINLIEKNLADADSFLGGYAKGFSAGVESVWGEIKNEF